MDENTHVGRWVAGIVAALVVLFVGMPLVFGSWFTVNPGEQGIVIRLGSINRIATAGFNFKVPYIESVVKIDTQTQKEQTTAEAASSDLQTVHTEVAVNYSIDSSKVVDLYTRIGEDYKSRVIDPAIQEAVKATTAKYTAEELITKRPAVQDDIKSSLVSRLSLQDIDVSAVSIINFDFSPTFNAAIEAKVTAEQTALAAKNKLDQIKYEAEQTVATAQAQAESIRLQSEAANNDKYVALKQLEVQKAFADKWNGVGCQNNCWGANAQNPIPFLNITK